MKKWNIRKLCLWAGAGLIAAAVAILGIWQWNIHAAQSQMETCVSSLRALMPEPRNAAVEARRDNTMPVLSLDGTDYIGILEMPSYGSALPVQAQWGSVTQSPCFYGGSAYDGTLQIGATSQTGQYDFYQELSVGDGVYFTDMAGNRYSYTVTNLHYAEHADRTSLEKNPGNLILFIKNIYDRQYLIVTCG